MKRRRLVVLGDIGGRPYGGQTWMFLHWLCGLRALGHDVWYVEDHLWWPYDPEQDAVTDDCAYAVRHVARAAANVGLGDRWAVRLPPRTDPHTRWAFDLHHVIVTYGENYGNADCGVPLNGIRYRTTRQPVDLHHWPMAYTPDARDFTTIGSYRQTGKDVEYQGKLYRWSKHYEWEKIIDLPSRTGQPFELAVNVDATDRQVLEGHGWRVVSPFRFSLDFFGAYPAYIRGSRGELTVAKDQNVRLRSGWFSDRDACYLASGKPVVAQDTGFSNMLPTGEGLFAFSTVEEAAAAVEAINADYPRHAKAARAIVDEYFEAGRVAQVLLQAIGLE